MVQCVSSDPYDGSRALPFFAEARRLTGIYAANKNTKLRKKQKSASPGDQPYGLRRKMAKKHVLRKAKKEIPRRFWVKARLFVVQETFQPKDATTYKF